MLTETETSFDSQVENPDYAPINVRKEAYNHLFSVIGWCYKAYFGITGDGDTLFRPEGFHMDTASVLSWPFAPAVAGRLDSMFHDNNTNVFEMSFHLDTNLNEPTEVIIQEQLHYPKGFIGKYAA